RHLAPPRREEWKVTRRGGMRIRQGCACAIVPGSYSARCRVIFEVGPRFSLPQRGRQVLSAICCCRTIGFVNPSTLIHTQGLSEPGISRIDTTGPVGTRCWSRCRESAGRGLVCGGKKRSNPGRNQGPGRRDGKSCS